VTWAEGARQGKLVSHSHRVGLLEEAVQPAGAQAAWLLGERGNSWLGGGCSLPAVSG